MPDLKCKSDIECLTIGNFKILERYEEVYVFDATDNLLIRLPRSGRDFDAWHDFVYYFLISLQTFMIFKTNSRSRFLRFYRLIYGTKRIDKLVLKIYDMQREKAKNKKAAR